MIASSRLRVGISPPGRDSKRHATTAFLSQENFKRLTESRTKMAALSTKRLVLNDLVPQDAHDLFEVRGDPEAMAFWDWPADASPRRVPWL